MPISKKMFPESFWRCLVRVNRNSKPAPSDQVNYFTKKITGSRDFRCGDCCEAEIGEDCPDVGYHVLLNVSGSIPRVEH